MRTDFFYAVPNKTPFLECRAKGAVYRETGAKPATHPRTG